MMKTTTTTHSCHCHDYCLLSSDWSPLSLPSIVVAAMDLVVVLFLVGPSPLGSFQLLLLLVGHHRCRPQRQRTRFDVVDVVSAASAADDDYYYLSLQSRPVPTTTNDSRQRRYHNLLLRTSQMMSSMSSIGVVVDGAIPSTIYQNFDYLRRCRPGNFIPHSIRRPVSRRCHHR